jgi:hypothetical protein
MYAEDMYNVAVGSLNPPADPRIAVSGWNIVGYLTAQDALIPSRSAPHQRLGVDAAKRVFFGFLARDRSDPTSFVAVVRGTEGIVEWLIDAEFLLIPHPRHAGTQVEQGFWNIYQTMSLADSATGLTTYQNAAEGIAKAIDAGTVTVTGHSLGSALATYLADDLAERLESRASACLFTSPRTAMPHGCRCSPPRSRAINFSTTFLTLSPMFRRSDMQHFPMPLSFNPRQRRRVSDSIFSAITM